MPNNSVNITRREQEAVRSSCEAVRLNIMGRVWAGICLILTISGILALIVR